MSAVTSVVSDVAGGAVDAVGGAVEGVANVVEEVAKPVVQAVDTTIQAAINDPIGTTLKVAAVASGHPELLPYISGAQAVANGASLEDMATSAAISYAGGQAGLEAGSYAPTDYAPYVQQAASGATNAALRGGDITQGALTNLINTQGNRAIANAINGPSTSGGAYDGEDAQGEALPDQPDSMRYTPLSSLDSEPVNYGLEGSTPGFKATMDTNVFNADGSVNYGLDPLGNPYFDFSGTGLQPSSSPNINKMNGAQGLTGTDANGTYSALGYTPFNASPNLGDPNSFINNPNVLGRYVSMTDTSNNLYLPKVNIAGALGLGSTSPSSSQSATAQKQSTSEKYNSPNLMAGDNLTGDTESDEYELARLRQLYGSIVPTTTMPTQNNVAQVTSMKNPMSFNTQGPLTMATGGVADSSKTTENVFPIAKTGISGGPLVGGGQRKTLQMAPLQQLKTQISQPRMAKGGLPAKYAEALPAGHKPEFITGLTGYYASGKGTGQSDDIDAMLHDGDYVADADLVAALGDGSSKAGAEALEKFRRQVPHQQHAQGGAAVAAKIADGEYVFPASFVTAIGAGDNKAGAKILDKMREAIREHKRSAPNNKIPPKAKSPLEYLKMAKG